MNSIIVPQKRRASVDLESPSRKRQRLVAYIYPRILTAMKRRAPQRVVRRELKRRELSNGSYAPGQVSYSITRYRPEPPKPKGTLVQRLQAAKEKAYRAALARDKPASVEVSACVLESGTVEDAVSKTTPSRNEEPLPSDNSSPEDQAGATQAISRGPVHPPTMEKATTPSAPRTASSSSNDSETPSKDRIPLKLLLELGMIEEYNRRITRANQLTLGMYSPQAYDWRARPAANEPHFHGDGAFSAAQRAKMACIGDEWCDKVAACRNCSGIGEGRRLSLAEWRAISERCRAEQVHTTPRNAANIVDELPVTPVKPKRVLIGKPPHGHTTSYERHLAEFKAADAGQLSTPTRMVKSLRALVCDKVRTVETTPRKGDGQLPTPPSSPPELYSPCSNASSNFERQDGTIGKSTDASGDRRPGPASRQAQPIDCTPADMAKTEPSDPKQDISSNASLHSKPVYTMPGAWRSSTISPPEIEQSTSPQVTQTPLKPAPTNNKALALRLKVKIPTTNGHLSYQQCPGRWPNSVRSSSSPTESWDTGREIDELSSTDESEDSFATVRECSSEETSTAAHRADVKSFERPRPVKVERQKVARKPSESLRRALLIEQGQQWKQQGLERHKQGDEMSSLRKDQQKSPRKGQHTEQQELPAITLPVGGYIDPNNRARRRAVKARQKQVEKSNEAVDTRAPQTVETQAVSSQTLACASSQYIRDPVNARQHRLPQIAKVTDSKAKPIPTTAEAKRADTALAFKQADNARARRQEWLERRARRQQVSNKKEEIPASKRYIWVKSGDIRSPERPEDAKKRLIVALKQTREEQKLILVVLFFDIKARIRKLAVATLAAFGVATFLRQLSCVTMLAVFRYVTQQERRRAQRLANVRNFDLEKYCTKVPRPSAKSLGARLNSVCDTALLEKTVGSISLLGDLDKTWRHLSLPSEQHDESDKAKTMAVLPFVDLKAKVTEHARVESNHRHAGSEVMKVELVQTGFKNYISDFDEQRLALLAQTANYLALEAVVTKSRQDRKSLKEYQQKQAAHATLSLRKVLGEQSDPTSSSLSGTDETEGASITLTEKISAVSDIMKNLVEVESGLPLGFTMPQTYDVAATHMLEDKVISWKRSLIVDLYNVALNYIAPRAQKLDADRSYPTIAAEALLETQTAFMEYCEKAVFDLGQPVNTGPFRRTLAEGPSEEDRQTSSMKSNSMAILGMGNAVSSTSPATPAKKPAVDEKTEPTPTGSRKLSGKRSDKLSEQHSQKGKPTELNKPELDETEARDAELAFRGRRRVIHSPPRRLPTWKPAQQEPSPERPNLTMPQKAGSPARLTTAALTEHDLDMSGSNVRAQTPATGRCRERSMSNVSSMGGVAIRSPGGVSYNGSGGVGLDSPDLPSQKMLSSEPSSPWSGASDVSSVDLDDNDFLDLNQTDSDQDTGGKDKSWGKQPKR